MNKMSVMVLLVFSDMFFSCGISNAGEMLNFQQQSYIPEFAWQEILSPEQAKHFNNGQPIKDKKELVEGELVLLKKSDTEWQFAQINFSVFGQVGPIIGYWSFDHDSSQSELVGTPETGDFYTLSSFWKELLQPDKSHRVDFPARFKAELDAFCDFQQNNPKKMKNDRVEVHIVRNREKPRIMEMGDLHGDLKSLAANLVHATMYDSFLNSDGKLANRFDYLVFTGDVGDRGVDDVYVWFSLLKLMNANDNHVIVTRGNHESEAIAQHYGYKDRFFQRIGEPSNVSQVSATELWPKMLVAWEYLPLALLMGVRGDDTAPFTDFIMFVHAGFDVSWYMEEPITLGLLLAPGDYNSCEMPLYKTVQGKQYPIMKLNFTWTDYLSTTLENLAKTDIDAYLVAEGKRKAGEESFNRAAIRVFCGEIENIFFDRACISSVFRGHDHAAVRNIGNIGKLTGYPQAPWQEVEANEKIPLSGTYDTYTFIAARNIYEVGADSRVNAYGIIFPSLHGGRWYLIPRKFQ